MTRAGAVFFSCVVGAGLGCTRPPAPVDPKAVDAAAFASPTDLVAALAEPVSVELQWKDNALEEAGYFVEYTNNQQDEFIVIETVPRDGTTFRHPDLMPDTRFFYRVRPFFGRPSNTVDVTTGKAPRVAPPDAAPAPSPVASGTIALRTMATAAEAAASDLGARLTAPTRVELTWKDNARDEDGYLVEGGTDPRGEFKPFAVLEPNITSFVRSGLPPETRCYFRVRAFFYGPPSNVAEATTEAAQGESP